MGAGASVQGVGGSFGPESNYTNTQEEKGERKFCYEESCLFPENPRYSVDMHGGVYDNEIRYNPVVSTNACGYRVVNLANRDGTRTVWYVHRMVGLTFLDQPEGCDEIDHIDGDRSNPDVTNLRWCNRSSQCANRTVLRTRKDGLPRGVYRDYKRYAVRIRVGNKFGWFGSYPTIGEAADAASRKRKELFGEFARDV